MSHSASLEKTEKQAEPEKKYCGNCRYHDVYQYPDLIFCFVRYGRNLDSVYPTLGYCELWEKKTQECFCIEEALKNERRKT